MARKSVRNSYRDESPRRWDDEKLTRRHQCAQAGIREEDRVVKTICEHEMRKRGLIVEIINLVIPGRGRRKVRDF